MRRFVPCFFATIAPPKGVLALRDIKEDVLNHIKRIHLPYTALDVGWWFQITLPRLPSGRNDYVHIGSPDFIVGTGTVPSAYTDLSDVGRFLARVVLDPRTLNKMVFAYSEVKTQNEVYDLLERVSGETIPRNYLSEETITTTVASLDLPPMGSPESYKLTQFQYWHSWGLRGDNTPEFARYLGYLDARELYPDFEPRTLELYAKDMLAGKAKKVYAEASQAKDYASGLQNH